MQKYFFDYQETFPLEGGGALHGFRLAYTTYGTLKPDGSNLVWVCHALTGNDDVESWWKGLFGNGCLFDPAEYFIICANVIGSCYGSTGPLSTNPETGKPYYHEFPQVSVRDMVRALNLLRQHLNLDRINTLIGGSLGGQQALEWAVMAPNLIENLIVMATNAKHSPWGIAFNETQRMAIAADPSWKEHKAKAGQEGLKAARAIAMLSYRNYETYQLTQSEPSNSQLDDYRAASYQQYQGQKLVDRFNAYAYWVLSKAMDSHNLGRGREGLEAALAKIQAYTQVISITTDVLFPVTEQRFLVRHLQNVTYEEINSTYGHDGFLVETPKLTKAISAFFKQKQRKQILNEEKY